MKVIWLQPYTGDNVSVRRERIASHLDDMGVDVTLVDASGRKAISAAYEAASGEYDIIVGNVRIGLYLGYLLSVILRKPFVGDVTDPLSQIRHLPNPLFKLLERYEWFVLENAEASVFVYQSSYQEALDRGISDSIRLPNAVDYEQFAEPDSSVVEKTRKILHANGVNLENRIAIYTGSMVERYHLAEVGDAAQRLPDWEFVFVGKERGADVHSIIADRPNVHFLGSFDYELIPGFLSHSDLGLCLIDAEQPLKLKEYTAARLPVLVIPKMKQWYDYPNLIYTEPTPDGIASAIDNLPQRQSSDVEITPEDRLESWKGISLEYYNLFARLYDSNV